MGPLAETLDLPVVMVVLVAAQEDGFGPHLGHLLYMYKGKITKYMYVVQFPIHRYRKVVMHHALHEIVIEGNW